MVEEAAPPRRRPRRRRRPERRTHRGGAVETVDLPTQAEADASAREEITDENADAAFDDLLKEVEEELSDG